MYLSFITTPLTCTDMLLSQSGDLMSRHKSLVFQEVWVISKSFLWEMIIGQKNPHTDFTVVWLYASWTDSSFLECRETSNHICTLAQLSHSDECSRGVTCSHIFFNTDTSFTDLLKGARFAYLLGSRRLIIPKIRSGCCELTTFCCEAPDAN